MTRTGDAVKVSAVDRRPLPEYDVLIAAVGFEARSAFIPLRLAATARVRVASAFDNRKVGSYGRNLALLAGVGFEVFEHREDEIHAWATKELTSVEAPGAGRELRVAVDISSFSRSRIAQLLLALREAAGSRRISVDFWYAPAAFSLEPLVDSTIRVAEPVTWEFAGWTEEPERPVAAVIGLGYEPGRAVGAADYLDVARTHIYAPHGVDKRYDEAVRTSNTDLLIEGSDRVSFYDVSDPYRIFTRLESLVYGLSAEYRVTLVPFGPKLFATCAMLVAMKSGGDVSVWRFSGDADEVPVDREPGGEAFHLAVELTADGDNV